MKNQDVFKVIALLLLMVGVPSVAFAQAPPPPGVPFDFGISALVAASVGYGAYKMKKNQNDKFDSDEK